MGRREPSEIDLVDKPAAHLLTHAEARTQGERGGRSREE